jgi:hypothetical protein
LTLNYSGHVDELEMGRCLESVRNFLPHLQSGFLLFSDLTHLDSMDLECAHDIGELMEICSEKGLSAVVRVIPDPTKDIGLNLISLFHYHGPVRVRTHENMAEAINDLVTELNVSVPADVNVGVAG